MAAPSQSSDTSRYRRRIQGYRGQSSRPSGGLDEYYALQNRNIPAFSGGRSAVPSAGQFADAALSQGRQINSDGSFIPYGADRIRGFREQNSLGGGMTQPMLSNLETPAANLPPPLPYSTAVGTPGNLNSPVGHEDNMRSARRGILQQTADDTRLLRQSTGELPTVTSQPGGGASIAGKYGSGSITAPGAPRQPFMVDGRPGQEFFQGAANRQQVANKYAAPSSKEDIALWRKAFDRIS